MSPHLDAARWTALQATRDDALLEHLASGCEACDAFLAALPGAGRLAPPSEYTHPFSEDACHCSHHRTSTDR